DLRADNFVSWRAQFSQPEVQNFQAFTRGDEQVLGFQIAMHDASLMRRRQTLRDLLRVFDCFLRSDVTCVKMMPQFLHFEQFSHDIRSSVVSSDVINRENVWMIESAGGLGFLLEAAQTI